MNIRTEIRTNIHAYTNEREYVPICMQKIRAKNMCNYGVNVFALIGKYIHSKLLAIATGKFTHGSAALSHTGVRRRSAAQNGRSSHAERSQRETCPSQAEPNSLCQRQACRPLRGAALSSAR